MKTATTLLVLGTSLLGIGLSAGWPGLFLDWLGVNFLYLGLAHVRQCPTVFGKRPDGRLAWWSWLIFFPLHLLGHVVWHLLRIVSSELPINRISDDLSIGRRVLGRERPIGFANYIDLTAEFAEPHAIRTAHGYLSFPILDASAPDPERLHTVVSSLRPGPTFIHCAQGHGRTGLFAVALMLQRGAVSTVEEGLHLLTEARPALRLNSAQLACLEEYQRLLQTKLPEQP